MASAHVILHESSDSEFECQKKSAEIKPNSSCEFPITFRPNLVDNIISKQCLRIVDRFDTNVTFVTIECFGSSPRPCVELSEDIIDFGRINVDTNTNASHALRLANTGAVAASFQFLIDSDCTAWNIYPNQGIVEPGGYVG